MGVNSGLRDLTKLQAQYESSKTDWANERTAWQAAEAKRASELVIANQAADDLLARERARVSELDRLLRAKTRDAESAYNQKLKELRDVENNAVRSIVAQSGDPVAGLWVNVENGSCTTSPGKGDPVPGATGAESISSSTQCRLSAPTAIALVTLFAEADSVATQLNLCVDQFRK